MTALKACLFLKAQNQSHNETSVFFSFPTVFTFFFRAGISSQLVIIPLTAPSSWQIHFQPLIMRRIIKYSWNCFTCTHPCLYVLLYVFFRCSSTENNQDSCVMSNEWLYTLLPLSAAIKGAPNPRWDPCGDWSKHFNPPWAELLFCFIR